MTPIPSATATEAPRSGSAFGKLARRPETGSFLGMLLVFTFFAIFGGMNFVTTGGLASWLNVASEIGIVALPSFIVTLGTLFAVAGLTLGISVYLTGSTGVPIKAAPVAKALFGQFVGGVQAQLGHGGDGRNAGRFRQPARCCGQRHRHGAPVRRHLPAEEHRPVVLCRPGADPPLRTVPHLGQENRQCGGGEGGARIRHHPDR